MTNVVVFLQSSTEIFAGQNRIFISNFGEFSAFPRKKSKVAQSGSFHFKIILRQEITPPYVNSTEAQLWT